MALDTHENHKYRFKYSILFSFIYYCIIFFNLGESSLI